MKLHTLEYKGMKYVLRYPREYVSGKRYPVVLFLHGAGSRGIEEDMLLKNPFWELTEKHQEISFISAAPLCCENSWFDLFQTLKEFTLFLFNAEFTDKKKVYAMGASMGGYAAWQLAMSLPEIFAAIVPICGGGMYWNAARLVNVPVWAFHGGKDPTVLVDESEKMVAAVNHNGGSARLTIYPDAGHDAWSSTYSDPEVFAWLLSRENRNMCEVKDAYHGSQAYG